MRRQAGSCVRAVDQRDTGPDPRLIVTVGSVDSGAVEERNAAQPTCGIVLDADVQGPPPCPRCNAAAHR